MSDPSRSPMFARIRAEALKDGRSPRKLAADAGMAHRTLADWLEGKEPAAFAALERLAGALGLRLEVKTRGKPSK